MDQGLQVGSQIAGVAAGAVDAVARGAGEDNPSFPICITENRNENARVEMAGRFFVKGRKDEGRNTQLILSRSSLTIWAIILKPSFSLE